MKREIRKKKIRKEKKKTLTLNDFNYKCLRLIFVNDKFIVILKILKILDFNSLGVMLYMIKIVTKLLQKLI